MLTTQKKNVPSITIVPSLTTYFCTNYQIYKQGSIPACFYGIKSTPPIKLNLPSFTYLAYFKISYNLQSGNSKIRKRISFRSEEQLQTQKTFKHSNKIFPKFRNKINPEKNRMSSFCISFLQKSETQFFTIVFSVRFQKRFPALNDLIGLFTYCMKQKYIYKKFTFCKNETE